MTWLLDRLPRRLPLRRLVALVVVAGTVGVVWLVNDPGSSDDGAGGPSTAVQSPEPATTAQFCASFEALAQAVAANSGANTLQKKMTVDVTALKVAAADARDVGSRAPLPDDAKPGLLYVTGLLVDLPDDASPADVALTDDNATVTQSAQVDAFIAFLTKSCSS